MVVLEECRGNGNDEEKFHIAIAKRDGLDLVNSTEGGELADFNRGRIVPDDQRAKMSASASRKGVRPANCLFSLGQENDICDEYLAGGITKVIAKKRGATHYTITDVLRRHGVPARPHNLLPHQIEKMRRSKIGSKQSDETRKRRSESMLGLKRGTFTDEHRRKLSESHKGKKQSPEFVARRIAASLAAKAAKKSRIA